MTSKIIFTQEDLSSLDIGEMLKLDDQKGYITRFPNGYVWTQYVFAGEHEAPALASVFIPEEEFPIQE